MELSSESPFLSLLLITGLAAFVPLLASRLRKLRLPIVVGEIIAGMIVGQSGFNWIEPSPALEFLTIFGFTYLMFISGLEVDFEVLAANSRDRAARSWMTNPLAIGLIVFGITVSIAFATAEGMLSFGLIEEPFMIALILSTTSLGIVVPVLKERGLISSTYGQTLLVSALIADFGTLVLITVDVIILSRGLTLEVLLVLLLLAAFAVAVRLGKLVASIPGLPPVIEELSSATAQIRVRGAMALMVAFIVLSEWLGTEVILGAFLAGAVISLLSRGSAPELFLKMDALGFGFFIPIFFIMVGVQFDLPALLSSPEAMLLVPLLLSVAYIIKFAAALLYRFNFSWRKTLAAGGLLSARLSLIIAAAAIALELGIIDQAIDSAIILVAIVSCTVSPLLFNRILPPEETSRRQGIIMVGLGEVSILLAERLLESGEQVTIVGLDRGRKRSARRQDFPMIEGDPTDPQLLAAAGASTAAALIAMSTYDEINQRVCQMAGEQFNIPNLIAQVHDLSIANHLIERGVRVVQPQFATTMALEGALRFPAAFDILTNRTDGVEIREIELNNPRLDRRRLRHVRLPGDALVLGLRRNGEILVPHGNTKLRQGDLLMLVGHQSALERAVIHLNS